MNKKNPYNLLTKEERRSLSHLGDKYFEIECQKDCLLIEARKIIGFDTPNEFDGFDEELEHLWDYIDSHKVIFLAYAQEHREKVELEKAVKDFKQLLSNQGLTLGDVDWG